MTARTETREQQGIEKRKSRLNSGAMTDKYNIGQTIL